VQCNILNARLGGDDPKVTHLLRVLIRGVVLIGLDQVLGGRLVCKARKSRIDAYLNKAIHTGFPASIKSDELAGVGVQFSANKSGVDGSWAWLDQVAFGLFRLWDCEFY